LNINPRRNSDWIANLSDSQYSE
jgi:hypothetical protein